MAKFFINRPVFAIVIALFITIAGFLCMFTLPVDRYPTITPPQISVRANYPGADSDVVEQTVAEVIEKQVTGVEGFDNMTSTSNADGSYSLTVQFLSGTDEDMANVRVQNAVQQADPSLPDTVRELGVTTKKSSSDIALVIGLTSPDGTFDDVWLKNYFSMNYLDEIKNIKGVGDVQEFGAEYGMRLWLDPTKMAQNNVTAAEVLAAVEAQNQQVAAGQLGARPEAGGQSFQYTIMVRGRLATPEEFGNIVLRTNPDGSMLHLSDVARVELDAKDYNFVSNSDGHQGSGIGISLTTDANAMETINAIKAKLEEDKKSFPAGMEATVIIDNTDFIMASITEVIHTFVEALILVAIIVYLFLQNFRSTLIPMVAVPVSLLGTFASFAILDFTINTLTLFAMVLAIGLVVDDAIVVIEAVEYEMRYNGKEPKEATIIAMEKVQSPVIGVAAVLAAVFVPVAFLGGVMGILYKQFALTIAVSVLISAFVALSLTPTLCAMLLKEGKKEADKGKLDRFFDWFNRSFDKMVERYGEILEKLGQKLVVPMGILIGLAACAGFLFLRLPTAFIPQEDNGYFLASISLPEGATLSRTYQAVDEYTKYINSQPGMLHYMGLAGMDVLSSGHKTSAGTAFFRLQPWDDRTTPDTQVDSYIAKSFAYSALHPTVNIIGMNPPPIPGLGASGGFTIYIQSKAGGSTQELYDIVQQFLAKANERPEIGNAYTMFRMDTPAYNFDIDRDKAMRNGVNVSDIFTTLQTYYGGVQINDFTIYGRNYKVVAQAASDYRMEPEDNKFLTVRDSSGNMVPISNFITPKQTSSAAVLTRFNNFPAIKIGGSQADGYSSGQALNALEEVAQEVLPTGYAYMFAETSQQEREAGDKTVYALGLGMLFVFLALAALYESWKVPFTVLFGIPTGFFGAAAAATALNVYNDIYFQIGLLTIIGLAAKNAILIVEYAKVRADAGMEVHKAAVEAAQIRLRPILMTSLAFILGCIPLALSTGAGSVSRSEMGIAVVFGTFSATVFSIFLTPMLFIVIEKIHGISFKRHRTEE